MTLYSAIFDQIWLLTLHNFLHYEQSLVYFVVALGKLVYNLVSQNAFVLTTAALSRRFKVTIDKKSTQSSCKHGLAAREEA